MKILAVICFALIGYASSFQQCAKPLDVVLVVEDSSLLPAGADTKLQSFLGGLVKYLDISPQGGPPSPLDQAAYVQYGSAANSVFHLNTYDQTNDARAKILQQPFSRAITTPPLIEQGLQSAWDTELTVTNGERSCYGTVIILVSYSSYIDPNNVGEVPPSNPQDRADLTAARRLTSSGARIITIGIGSNRNAKHLQQLASAPNLYIDFQTFDQLSEDAGANITRDYACNFDPTGVFYPGEMPTVKADFTFVVDVSKAFTQALADDITAFLQAFLEPFSYDHVYGVQASLVTFSDRAGVTIKFQDADDLPSFIDKVKAVFAAALACPTCLADSRCIDQALNKVNYEIFASPYLRPFDTVHYVYVFSAGCFNCDDPVPVAKLIRGQNAEIFVVTLQDYQPVKASTAYPFAFWKEPLEIADDYSHVFEAQANPAVILANYLPKQAWRNVFVSQKNVIPAPTTTPETTTTGPSTTVPTTTVTTQ